MFIKNSVFKKVIKEAWSGPGLTIGNMHGRYVIITDIMTMFVKTDCITKEVKGALIELAGDLPVIGEIYTAYKNGENQQVLKTDEILNGDLHESADLSKEWIETHIMTTNGSIIMQNKDGLEKCMIPVNVMSLIKPSEKEEGESWPQGPISGKKGDFMVWRNETTVITTPKKSAGENSIGGVVLKLLEPCDWRADSESRI